jgi:HEAT repeat protein
MRQGQILEFLQSLDKSRRRITAEELAVLYELARHPHPQVRSEVAGLLMDHYEEKSEAILLELTHDPDSGVRTDAADSLCIGRKKAALERLAVLAERDPANTVRGFAVHSIYDVLLNCFGDSDNTMLMVQTILRPLLEKEADAWVRVCFFCVLYLSGDHSHLQELLDSLDNEDFYVRSGVLETFEDIIDEENEQRIEEAIQYYMPFEENENLQNKMEDLLLMIEENKDDHIW